ncbi:MAG: transglutaminase-like domain-containing protein [Flavobacteriales bacterium]
MTEYLCSTEVIDSNHQAVLNFVERFQDESDERLQIVALYQAVRDEFFYDPFGINVTPSEQQASKLVAQGKGHCIDKALFFIACARALKIPARLGLAKVKNHIGTAKFEQIIQSNVLVPHGYAEVFVNEQWLKCTPAFNKSLCQKLGVEALEFDGVNDSVFQAYTSNGVAFMEYIEDYGTFSHFPLDFIIELLQEHYPHLFQEDGTLDHEKFKL